MMQRGLEGRRIAVFATQDVGVVTNLLQLAGAGVQSLSAASLKDEDWHGGNYASLVIIGDSGDRMRGDAKLMQLVRELLVVDKPLAVFGSALGVLLDAGGAAGRTIAADSGLRAELEGAGAKVVDEAIHVDDGLITARASADLTDFGNRLVRELGSRLEERDVDEGSELSFPASDPPASSAPRRPEHGEPRSEL